MKRPVTSAHTAGARSRGPLRDRRGNGRRGPDGGLLHIDGELDVEASGRSAVSAFRPTRFSDAPSEPDVQVFAGSSRQLRNHLPNKPRRLCNTVSDLLLGRSFVLRPYEAGQA